MSDKQKDNATHVTVGFLDLLAIAFIVLKLTGTITWSWWWVLAPVWMPIALIFGFFLLVGVAVVIGIIVQMVGEYGKWK